MRIWVTGAQGMLGSALLECCRKRGIDVVGTGKNEADVSNLESLKRTALQLSPTHIVNCAAFTDVDGSESDPVRAFAINAEGAGHMALVAKECGARLVHISTDYVFDGRGAKPYCEEDCPSPINVYGKSKWEGEERVKALMPEACIVRSSWLFGRRGKNFISSLLHWFEHKEELQVVADQCGKPTYCADLAEAVVALLDASGVIHFANEGECSRYQMALVLWEAAQKRGELKCQKIVPVGSAQFPTLAKRPAYSVLDTSNFWKLTKIKPRLWSETLSELLYETVAL